MKVYIIYDSECLFADASSSPCVVDNFIFADHCCPLVPARRVPPQIRGGCAPVGDGVRCVGPPGVRSAVHGAAPAFVSRSAAERGGRHSVSAVNRHSLFAGRGSGQRGAAVLHGPHGNRQ